jgi:hypothetical protein
MSLREKWAASKARTRVRKEWDWKNHPELREKALRRYLSFFALLGWSFSLSLLSGIMALAKAHPEAFSERTIPPGALEIAFIFGCGVFYALVALSDFISYRELYAQLRLLRAAAGVS